MEILIYIAFGILGIILMLWIIFDFRFEIDTLNKEFRIYYKNPDPFKDYEELKVIKWRKEK